MVTMHRTTLPLNIMLSALILIMASRILADVATYRLGQVAPGSAPLAVAGGSSRQQPPLDLRNCAPILAQGLFGPATRGVLTPLAAASTTAAAPAVPQTDLLLLGTAAGSPRESFILIHRTSTGDERVFRLGERVFDLGLLVAVHKESADIRNQGQTITLRTPTSPTGPATAPQSAVQGAGPGVGVIQATPGGAGVIDQRALNAALSNIGQAMTDARLLPSVKDGKVEGFRLSEVKPQGVFAAVGLKNGDILMRINDFPIDSPEKAIQSFMTLKGQSRIKLDLVRDGAPTTLTYDIR